jgi:hypothetical protein
MSLRRSAKSPYWRDELLDLEQRLLDPSVRGSPQAVVPLLHPDFVEFGSSGRVYTKEMMVQMMLQQAPGVVRIRDFDVREITPEAALSPIEPSAPRARRPDEARSGSVAGADGRSCSIREPGSTPVTVRCHRSKGGHRLARL